MSRSKKIGRQLARNASKSVTKTKVLSTMLALGVAMAPWGIRPADAAEGDNGIVRVGSTENLMKDNIAKIYAEQKYANGNVGLNRFKYFDVKNNQIANLYFNVEGDSQKLSTLINMVQNQINIAGTVNAIRDNKIGGNLMFLSPKGMVVSGTGVINAGALTVMTPTEDFFKKAGVAFKKKAVTTVITGNEKESDNTTTTENTYTMDTVNLWEANADQLAGFMGLNGDKLAAGTYVTGMTDTKDDKGTVTGRELVTAEIPVSGDGSITVQGKINTADLVKLVAANATVDSAAVIKSGIAFGSITNLGTAAQTVDTTGALTVSADDEGNIVLSGDSYDADTSTAYVAKNTITEAVDKTEVTKTTEVETTANNKTTKVTTKETTVNSTITYKSKYAASKGADGTTGSDKNSGRKTTKTEKKDPVTETKDGVTTKTTESTITDTYNNAASKVDTKFVDVAAAGTSGDGSITISATASQANAKSDNKFFSFMSWFGNDSINPSDADFKASLAALIGETGIEGIDSKLAEIKAGKTTYQQVWEQYTSGAMNIVQAKLDVKKGATINAAGNVNLTATAVADHTVDTDEAASNLSNQLAIAKANTTVAGNVSGKDVTISASATTTYDASKISGLGDVMAGNNKVKNLLNILPEAVTGNLAKVTGFLNNAHVALGINESQATVTVDKDAVIIAAALKNAEGDPVTYKKTVGEGDDAKTIDAVVGGNLTVNAASTATDKIDVKIVTTDDNSGNGQGTGSETKPTALFNAGVIYESVDNVATTNINGKVSAETSLNLTADATADVKLNLVMAKADKAEEGKKSSSYINAGVGILNVNNKSTVNVAAADDAVATSGELNIAANTTNTIEDNVKVETDSNSAANTAFTYAGITTDAIANINSSVKGNTVSILTNNETKTLKVITDNSYGNEKKDKDNNEENGGNGEGAGDAGNKSSQDSEDQTVVETHLSQDTTSANSGSEGLSSLLQNAGENTHDSNRGDSEDRDSNPDGGASMDESQTKWNDYFGIGASVNVANVNNKSAVNIANGVTVESTWTEAPITEEAGPTESMNIKSALKVASAEISAASKMVNDNDTTKFTSSAAVAVGNIINHSDVNIGLNGTAEKHATVKAGSGMVNIGAEDEWSGSFKANATTGINKEGTAPTKFNISGSVGVENLKNNAAVNVGTNAQVVEALADTDKLAANGGGLSISASSSDTNTMTIGKFGKTDEGDSTVGVGGSVGISNIKTNSNINVNDGVTLRGDMAVSLNTSNTAINTSIVNGGVKAGTLGLSGMVNYMAGESNAKTLVDDDANIITGGAVSLGASDNSLITNETGSFNSSAGIGIGASVGIISYDVHSLAQVNNLDGDSKHDGGIYGGSLAVNAINMGAINNLSIAGVSSQEKTAEPNTQDGDNDERQGVNTSVRGTDFEGNRSDNPADRISLNRLQGGADGLTESAPPTTPGEGSSGSGDEAGPASDQETQEQESANSAFKVSVAGSVSINDISNKTIASIEGTQVNITPIPEAFDGSVSFVASDNTVIGAYGGAMALTKAGIKDGDSAFSGTLSGAVAINDVSKNTKALIDSSAINGATAVKNAAENMGLQIATGVGLGIEKGNRESAAGFDMVGSVSLNKVKSDVEAKINKATIASAAGTPSVTNVAYDKDIQIGGGVAVDFAKSAAALGAAVTVNNVTNNIKATISDSSIGTGAAYAGAINNLAVSKLIQTGTALSVGISTGSSHTYFSGNGAVAVERVTNNVNATADNNTIYAADFSNTAADGNYSDTVLNQTIEMVKNLIKGMSGFEQDKELDKAKNDMKGAVDPEASDIIKDNENSNQDIDVKTDTNGDVNTTDNGEADYTSGKITSDTSGNLIVGAALAVTGNGSKNFGGSAAASVVYNTIDNDFKSTVKNSTINLSGPSDKALDVEALSNTRMYGFGAGVAVATSKKGFAAAGSGTVQKISNDTVATIDNSTVNADGIRVNAESKSMLLTVAGQVGLSLGNVTAGMTWAQNNLNNNIGAYVYGTDFDKGSASGTPVVSLNAVNNDKTWAISTGASVTVASGAISGAAAGAYSTNNGGTDVEAVMGVSKDHGNKGNTLGQNSKTSGSVYAKASDTSELKAIAGNIGVGAKASLSLGGSVVNNNIGSASDRNNLKAQISNLNVYTDNNSSAKDIYAEAVNDAKIKGFAIGGAAAVNPGGSFTVGAQGSVSIGNIYTDTMSSIANINVIGANKLNTILSSAKGNNEILNVAGGLTISAGSTAGISALGTLAKTVSSMDVTAEIDSISNGAGGKAAANYVNAAATSDDKLLNISAALNVAQGSAAGIGLTGNVDLNRISNNVVAQLKNSKLQTDVIAVKANSTDTLRNYGGALTVGVGLGPAGLALGATVVNNTIDGNTRALVVDSDLVARGVSSHKGLIVSADSTHVLKDISVTGGVAVGGVVGAGINATVLNNTIQGETKASVSNTDVNKGVSTWTDSNVNVTANDKTDMDSHIGTLSVGAAPTAGVSAGASVDNNRITRATTAEIVAGSTKVLNAYDTAVKALSDTKIRMTESGLSVGGAATAGVGVTGVVSVNRFDNKTIAKMDKMSGAMSSMTIDGKSTKDITSYTNAASVTGGLAAVSATAAVVNTNDYSDTEAILTNSTITKGTKAGKVDVTASNSTTTNTEVAAGAIAVGIGGGAGVTVDKGSMTNKVSTNVANTTIGTADAAFGDYTQSAKDTVKRTFMNISAAGGLVGIGVGVGVNTFDSAVVNNISSSNIYASSIRLSATDDRTINQKAIGATIGGAAIGTNVIINNIGTAFADQYTDGDNSQGNFDTTKIQGTVNQALAESVAANNYVAGSKYGKDIVNTDTSTLVFDKGGTGEGIQNNVNGANVVASGALSINSVDNTNANIDVYQGSLGWAGINVSVGLNNITAKNGITLKGGRIQGSSINLGVNEGGTISQNVYQGSVGGLASNVAVSKITRNGENSINIGDKDGVVATNLIATRTTTDAIPTGTSSINIAVNNNSVFNNNTNGMSAGYVTGGALIANTADYSNNAVNISGKASLIAVDYQKLSETITTEAQRKTTVVDGEKGNTLLSTSASDPSKSITVDETKPFYGTISINAANATELKSVVKVGAVGLASGYGAIAKAYNGNSTSGNTVINVSGSNTFGAKDVTIGAYNKGKVQAESSSIGAGLVSVNVPLVEAVLQGSAKTLIGNNQTFIAEQVKLAASNTGSSAKADTLGVAAGGAAIQVNKALAKSDMVIQLDVGEENYGTSTWEDTKTTYDEASATHNSPAAAVTITTAHENITSGGTKLNMEVFADSNLEAKVDSLAAGIIASGTNIATTQNNSAVTLNFNPGSYKAGGLDIKVSNLSTSDTKAVGNGGGIANISPVAASAVHTDNSSATINMSGTYDIAGDVVISVAAKAATELQSEALQAAVLNGSGVDAENNTTLTSTINMNDVTLNADGNVKIGSNSYVDFNKKNKYALKSGGYGAASAEVATLKNTVVTNSNTNINGTTSINSGGNQKLWAKTDNDINSKAYVYSGGILSGTFVRNILDITANDTVNVAQNAKLFTKGNSNTITLAAYDAQTADTHTLAETYGGVVGATSAVVKNNFNRNNTISVSGVIFSRYDVNLNAGKDEEGNISKLFVETTAEAFTGGVIPIAIKPTNEVNISLQNVIDVKSTGNVQAMRDVNMYASTGKMATDIFSGNFTGWGSKGNSTYASTTNGEVTVKDGQGVAYGSANRVNVDGKVIAGIGYSQFITIGQLGDIVLIDDEQFKAVQAYFAGRGQQVDNRYVVVLKDAEYDAKGLNKSNQGHYRKLSEYVTIKNGTGTDAQDVSDLLKIYASDFTLSNRELATSMTKRVSELEQILNSYGDSQSSAAYIGFKAEYDRLKDQLKEMGLVNAAGEVVNSIFVNYIDVPDLAAYGGNVNVTTDKNFYSTTGAGQVTANGNPTVQVINNTSLATDINKIHVSNPGGQITYNGNIMNAGTDQSVSAINAALAKSIASANVNHSITVSKALASATTAAEGTILIQSNNSNAYQNYRDEVGEKTMKIMSDVTIQGNVDAGKGKVSVTATTGSIYIQGKKPGDSVSVTGKDVELKSSSGNVGTSYIEGIYNVGGDLTQQYTMQKVDESASGTYNQDAVIYIGNGANVSGSNVYINATDVNINGLVQSGYEKQYVTINKDDKLDSKLNISASGSITVADRMQAIINNNGGATVDDNVVVGNSNYLLIQGGTKKNSSGYYDYQLPVYYNPSSGNLVLPDVDANGGKVYITGRVSSTGNGSIYCLDGTYNIDIINNNINKTLKVGTLLANDTTGLIRITDTAKSGTIGGKNYSYITTEYTRDKAGTIKAVTNYINSKGETVNTSSNSTDKGTAVHYNPLTGLRYNWSTGVADAGTIYTYRKTWYNSWWGAGGATETSQGLIDSEKNATQIDKVEGELQKKLTGTYIGAASGANSGDIYDVIYNLQTLDSDYAYTTKIRKWSQGYLNCHKYTEVTWNHVTAPTIKTYLNSVKADQPIAINFIGNNTGESKVNINSTQDIILGGLVGNRNLYDGVAERGSVNITSKTGSIIQNAGDIYAKDVILTAANNIKDISITAGDKVNVSAVQTGTDKATERVVGITVNSQAGTKGDVAFGEVGNSTTTSVALKTTGASGNISMQNDIATITGSRIDLISTNGSINALVNAGQTPLGANTLTASLNADAKGDITLTQKAGDMRIGTIYSTNGDVVLNSPGTLIDALPYEDLKGSTEDENKLINKWLEAGLITTKDSDDKDKVAYSEALVAEKKAVLQKAKDQGLIEDSSYYNFTREALLYAVQEGIINPGPETAHTTGVKNPNIRGNNITLNTSLGAGLDSEKIINMKISTLGDSSKAGYTSGTTGLDDLKLLARADASNVTWQGSQDNIQIKQKLPIGVQTNTSAGVVSIGKTGQISGNAYIEGRVDAETQSGNKDLTIGTVNTAADARITSLGAIYNGLSDATKAAITAKNLYLEAGTVIGTADKAITTDINGGFIRALAGGNGIFLNNVGSNDMYLSAISANGNIDITSVGNIYHAASDSDIPFVVFANGKDITITSKTGSVGKAKKAGDQLAEDEDGMLILNEYSGNDSAVAFYTGEGTVTINAAKDIFVSALGRSGDANGTLNLSVKGSAATDNIGVAVDGHLNMLSGDVASNKLISLDSAKTLINSVANISSKAVKMRSGEDIKLQSGVISGIDSVQLKASNAITEQYNNTNESPANGGFIKTAQLTAIAGGTMDLGSRYNQLQNVTLDNQAAAGIDNSINLGNGGSKDVTVIVKNSKNENKITGNIYIRNYDDKASDATTDNNLTVAGDLKATGNISIINDELAVTNNGVLNAANIELLGKTGVNNINRATATANVTMISSDGDVTNKGSLQSEDITMTGNNVNNLTSAATINASGKTIMQAKAGSVTNEAEIFAKSTQLTATLDINNSGSLHMDANGLMVAQRDVNNSGDIDLSGNMPIVAGRDINNSGNIISDAEGSFIYLKAQRDINNTGVGVISSAGSVDMEAQRYIKISSGEVDADILIDLEAGSRIENMAKLVVNNGNLKMLSKGTDETIDSVEYYAIENGGVINVKADVDISTSNANGSIANYEILQAGNNIDIKAGRNLLNYGYKFDTDASGRADITAGNDVSLTAEHGSIINDADIKSGDATVIKAVESSVINSGNIDIGNKGIITAGDNIINDGNYIKAVNDIDMEAQNKLYNEASLISKSDNIKLIAHGDSADRVTLVNSGSIDAYGNAVLIAENGQLENAMNIHSSNGYIELDAAKDIINYNVGDGLGIVTDNGHVSLKSYEGNVLNASVIRADGTDKDMAYVMLNADKGSVMNLTGSENAILAMGQIQLFAGMGVYNTASLESANDNVILTAGGLVFNTNGMNDKVIDLLDSLPEMRDELKETIRSNLAGTSNGTVKAGKNVIMTTTVKNKELGILNDAKIDAGNDAVLITKGGLVNSGTITVKGSLNSIAAYDVDNVKGADITAGGYVNMVSGIGVNMNDFEADINLDKLIDRVSVASLGEGDVFNQGSIEAGTHVGLGAYKGNVINTNSIIAKTEGIALLAKAGNDADRDILVPDKLFGIFDSQGNAAQSYKYGNVTNTTYGSDTDTDLTAGSKVLIMADHNILNSGDLTVKNKGVTEGIILKAGYNIMNTAAVAGHGTGSMRVTSKGDITMEAGEDIYNSGILSTEHGNVTMTVNHGNLFNAEKAYIYTGAGDVSLSSHATADEKILIQYHGLHKELVPEGSLGFVSNSVIRQQFNNGSVFNVGDLMALDGTIRLQSDNADVFNYDDYNSLYVTNALGERRQTKRYVTGLKAPSDALQGILISTGDIELLAPHGSVVNAHDLVSEANVKLEADDDLSNLAFNIIANKNITLLSHSGNVMNSAVLQSYEGDISLIAENGTVGNLRKGYDLDFHEYDGSVTHHQNDNGGDIIAKDGKVILSAGGDGTDTISVADLNPEDSGKYTFNFRTGSVVNNGDIVSMGNRGEIKMVSANADVYNYTDFNRLIDSKGDGVGEHADGSYWYTPITGTKMKSDFQIASGDITLEAPNGFLYSGKDLESMTGSVSLKAQTGLSNFGFNIYADKNITLWATAGDVINSAVLEANSGDVTLKADNGTLINRQGADIVTLGGSVKLEASAETDGGLYFLDNYNTSKDEMITGDNGVKSLNAALEAFATKQLIAHNVESYKIDRYYDDPATGQTIKIKTTMTAPENAKNLKTVVNYKLTDGSTGTKTFDGDIAVFRKGAAVNYGDLIAISQNRPEGVAEADAGNILMKSAHSDVLNYDDFNKSSTGYNEALEAITKETVSELYTAHNGASFNAATGNIELRAPEGTVYNSKKLLVALGSVTWEAGKDMDSFGNSIYAGKDINLTAKTGTLANNAALVSMTGNIDINATEGSVVNMLSGDAMSLQGSVNIYAGGKAEGTDAGKVFFVDTNGDKGEISITGSQLTDGAILVVDKYYQESGSGQWKIIDDTVNIKGLSNAEQNSIASVFYYIAEDGTKVYPDSVTFTDSVTGPVDRVTVNTTDAAGNAVTLSGINRDAEAYHIGDVVNRGDLVAIGDQNVNQRFDAEGNVVSIDQRTGNGITLKSEHSNVANYDNFIMVDGSKSLNIDGTKVFNSGTTYHANENIGLLSVSDIMLRGREGYLYNNMDISSGRDVELTSFYSLNSSVNFMGIDAGRDILLQSLGKNVTNGAVITAGSTASGSTTGGDLSIKAKTNITNYNTLTANAGNNSANSKTGNVLLDTAESGNGAIYNEANITAGMLPDGTFTTDKTSGSITIDSENGITSIGNLMAASNLTMYTDGRVAELDADGNYKVDENGKDIVAKDADGNNIISNLVINGNLTANNGILRIWNDQADVTDDITNINQLYGDRSGITLTNDTKLVANRAINNPSRADGSASIGSSQGSINLGNVWAQEMAAIGVYDDSENVLQSVKLGTVSGKDVVLYNAEGKQLLDEEGKQYNISAEQVNAGDYLVVQAGSAQLKETNRIVNTDASNRGTNSGLTSVITGLNGGTMGGDFNMKVAGDTRFTALNVTDANIKITDGGVLAIDKLKVAGTGIFTAKDYNTGVYGIIPNRDNNKATYFDFGNGDGSALDIDLGDLYFKREDKTLNIMDALNKLDSFAAASETHRADVTGDNSLAANDNWMNLYIDTEHNQRSNGLLLRIKTRYYSSNQRFSVIESSNQMVDFRPESIYTNAHVGPFVIPNRFNLLDIPTQLYGNAFPYSDSYAAWVRENELVIGSDEDMPKEEV